MILRAGAALAALMLAGAAPIDLDTTLRDTAAAYYAGVANVAKITTRDATMDYYQRLLDDREVVAAPAPSGYSVEMWEHWGRETSRLDLSVANQLLSRSFTPMAPIRGLDETFVRSSLDGTMQPVAVYVPSTYVPGKAVPLIVFLHGRPQSESELISQSFIENLAEKNGTIIVAPYGRGYYDYRGSESDVYDALDAATQAFSIDPRKQYLMGYSMGGFSVYHVAPVHPQRWAAVMSIAGALLGSEAKSITAFMHGTPFYVLTGSDDDSIPTQYPTGTAVYLRNVGMDVSYYSQPGGQHRLLTLLPILTQAWSDMESGVIRTPAITSSIPLPMAPPPAFTKS